MGGWVAVVFYVGWKDTDDHPASPWLWVVWIGGFAFLAVRAAPRVVAALRAPDRPRFELNRTWIGFFGGVVLCLVLGQALVLDTDAGAPLIGVPVFLLGVAAALLFLR